MMTNTIVRWLELFPREQLLIVNGDQLIEDPLSQIRRIEDFLGKNYLSLPCTINRNHYD